ncbi:unnamed protein product [Nippostrongylus brasiliensis]|uniref:Uncharacterized protein n=1 Tax=Nippostrongylus brasiliensis TaxID=27835 RepID=A0A0N4Y3G4_NIPBR|nr:unnamed protein product [Nippostrongylus brasiliensis]
MLAHANPGVVERNGPLGFRGDAKPHVSRKPLQKLNDYSYETLPHPANSLDPSSKDRHIFDRFNNFVKDRVPRNQTGAQTDFDGFVACRNPDFYRKCIDYLICCWRKYGDSNVAHFIQKRFV